MIYVNVRGNFGNQLFEYALARRLQEKYKQTICLNIYDLTKYRKEYTFNLTGYTLNSNVIIEKNKPFPFLINQRKNKLLKIIRKIFPNLTFYFLRVFGIYIWLGNTYKKVGLRYHKDFYLDGYWQCDKYFDEVSDILRKEFKVKKDKDLNNEIYKKIQENDTVCVSIRRGDYITNDKYKKIFYVCNENYFNKAMAYFKERNDKCKFFICSDDIEWAREYFKNRNDVFFETGKDDVFEKLKMMSLCNNFILSNSTFSWWAQYLSVAKNKKVIAPINWYTNGQKTDIYEKDWILMNTEK